MRHHSPFSEGVKFEQNFFRKRELLCGLGVGIMEKKKSPRINKDQNQPNIVDLSPKPDKWQKNYLLFFADL